MSGTTEIKNLNEVIWLRVFAIFSLVAWHSYCPYVCWGLAHSPFDGLYSLVFRIIAPIANMPTFTFLSGYLFCYLHVYCNKYKTFKGILGNKAKRLLIPYIILGSFMNLTMIGKNYIDIFYGIPNHLWYCLMLFYCFIVCWLVENKMGRWLNCVLAIVSFGFVLYYGGQYLEKSPLGLFLPGYYYSFFFLGYFVYSKKDIVINGKRYLVPILFLLYILTIIFPIGGHLEGVTSVLFVFLLLIGSSSIKMNPPQCVKIISKYSFGIFVFHQWIIWNVTRYEPMSSIMKEHYILFPLLLFISVLVISFILTHFAFKTKAGRFLLC